MRVLLINPVRRNFSVEVFRFPLGLAYIAEALRESGHSVKVLDMALSRQWKRTDLNDLAGELLDADAYGLSGLITEYDGIKEISSFLKEKYPLRPVVLGGAFATAVPEYLLSSTDVDIIVSSEGEETAKELFLSLENGGPLAGVKGIWFKENGGFTFTGRREYIADLDSLGFPSRADFSMEGYFAFSPLKVFGARRTGNIITSRGCPYGCSYCDRSLWGNKFRARSAVNVADEISYLKERYGIDSLIVHDDTVNIDKARLHELCDLLVSRKLGIDWLANCRINSLDMDLLKHMRASGCRLIAYGIESGSQRVLDDMCKMMDLKQAGRVIAMTWKAGIIPFAYLMIGWFGETRSQVMDTVDFCLKNRIKGDFSFFTPIPGTSAFGRARSEGRISGDIAEVVSSWGKWHERGLVNLSAMSDEELSGVKKEAEKRIFWGNLFADVFLYLRVIGTRRLAVELFRRLFSRQAGSLKVRCE